MFAFMKTVVLLVILCTVVPALHAQTGDVELRQVISREHPALGTTGQGLSLGRDGQVYVYGGQGGNGYVLRIARDGSVKFGFQAVYAITGVAANTDGVVATSNAHFAKSVNTYSRLGSKLGQVDGFTGNDNVGWDGPGTLEVGSSGDFFALDQHANRIVRLSPAGQIIRSYPLRGEGEPAWGRLWPYGFRVCEAREQFYYIVDNQIRCVGFDGRTRWSIDTRIAGDPWGGFSGGFDVLEDGTLYVNHGQEPVVRIVDAQGKPLGEVTLAMGDRAPNGQRRISHLRVAGDDIVLRQNSDTEIFQVYHRTTGAFVRAVDAAHEMLTVRFKEYVWTAGKPVPLTIDFAAGQPNIRPNLRAWLRPLGTVGFQELPLVDGSVTPPAGGSGLYQLRITAGIAGAASEYQVEEIIELRPSDAQGSISVFTPHNRCYYARGEAISFHVACRSRDVQPVPAEVVVNLVDALDKIVGTVIVKNERQVRDPLPGTLTAEQTRTLAPGAYRLTTTQPGWTIASQYLEIGAGGEPWQAAAGQTVPTQPFGLVQHGDYYAAFPEANFWNAAENVNRHLQSARRLGLNTYVDRLGHGGSGVMPELTNSLTNSDLQTRLQNDPIAVAPAKAEFPNRVLQTVAGYGAQGIEQRAILLYMDAGLPLGTGFDQRSPQQMEQDVAKVTQAFDDYPAFRGWSWAANWWIDKRGAAATENDQQRVDYEKALQIANETGQWSPVLDQVSDRWINHAIDAERRLRGTLEQQAQRNSASPRRISAITGPYRQPGILPTLTFAGADEVDLHFQAEQIQWPMISAHHVDFYKRPGKRAWGHPELWNDDGTGGQILSNQLQMVMRGADGIGQSGSTKGFAPLPSDARSMGPGATSIHRTINGWLREYGPWLSSLKASDPVAIPVSTRMMRLELGWQGVGGFYFTRLFEAYNACLRAHRPASFVFTEDCQPDTFTNYKAVLLVSQTVELDAPLVAALQQASAAGVPIYSDKSCRTGMVSGAKPLDIEFTHVERDHHVLNDDSAFWRYREYMLAHAQKLRAAFGDEVLPIARCEEPEVLLTERRLGDLRVLWGVNDAALPLDPGQLWRVSLAVGSRLPVQTSVEWNVDTNYEIYELFSGAKFAPGKSLPLDLKTSPARVYVAVPKNSDRSALPGVLQSRPGEEAIAERFAARLRDVVVNSRGDVALITAAGWDRNVFLIDPRTGTTTSQGKAGHHFAYAPIVTSAGFAVQGFDLTSAEGYHLYLADDAHADKFSRRFALYGLPKRGTGWASARQMQDPINNFAISPDGQWVASAGDLGLAVFQRGGDKLWSDDWWKQDERRRVHLLAADAKTLITMTGAIAAARDATTGTPLWQLELGATGELSLSVASADGRTLAFRSSAEGGRIFILRDGKLLNTLPTASNEMAISPNGEWLAVTNSSELKLFDVEGGLRWSYAGDDFLRSLRISPDSLRLVVGSELGMLHVLDREGQVLHTQDMNALPVAAWMREGELLVATWLGKVCCLNAQYQPKWTTSLQPDAVSAAAELLAADGTPTSRVTDWGNAAPEAAPLTPNLLTQTQALVEPWSVPKTHGDPRTWQQNVELLRDGKPTVSDGPWLDWTDISYLDSGWREKLSIQIDTFRTQVRLSGITMVEDERHPQSWVRDARLQWWNAAAESWNDGPMLLSNQSVHTHWFDKPIEAAKFRLVSTGGGSWPVGNLRWGELVLHGEAIGPSHPDAVANRPVAVLFDEREDDLKHLMAYGSYPFAFRYDDAYSGGKCLALKEAGQTAPHWRPPFGHVLPNWDFEIVENPKLPGQYRWLQFAWKATSPQTKGVTLRVGPHHGGGVALNAGEATVFELSKSVQQSQIAPTKWEVVRVDLWKLAGTSFQVRSLSLASIGGSAAFDQIILGRAEEDCARFPHPEMK